MTDPRHPSYILYSQSDLFYMGLLKNICGVKTMHAMEEQFYEKTCIETLRILSGDGNLREMSHSDTLNCYLERLSPKCLSGLRKNMVKSLTRMKSFYRGRLSVCIRGEYVNHVEETAGKEEIANLFSYTYEREREGEKQTVTFKWLTDIELREKSG